MAVVVSCMEVEIVSCTDEPEKTVCLSARNDYMQEFVGDVSFEQAMSSIEGDSREEKMETLIHQLLKRGHFGPFEHVSATFAVKGVSRSLMAQLTRHRHASFDVQSMRYVSFDDAVPEPGEAVVSIPALDDADYVARRAETADRYEEYSDELLCESRTKQYEAAIRQSFTSYQNLLDMGVPPEDARMVLPIGTKINLVFTVNLRMLLHIADMRAVADAQWEIRQLTDEVLSLAADWAPLTIEYYEQEMKNRKNRLAP